MLGASLRMRPRSSYYSQRACREIPQRARQSSPEGLTSCFSRLYCLHSLLFISMLYSVTAGSSPFSRPAASRPNWPTRCLSGPDASDAEEGGGGLGGNNNNNSSGGGGGGLGRARSCPGSCRLASPVQFSPSRKPTTDGRRGSPAAGAGSGEPGRPAAARVAGCWGQRSAAQDQELHLVRRSHSLLCSLF